MKNIIKKIKFERRRLKLTQKQLAQMTGVTRSWIAAIENGRSKTINHEWLQKFAAITGKPVEYFLDDKQTDEAMPVTVENPVGEVSQIIQEKTKQINKCYKAFVNHEVTDRIEERRIAHGVSQATFCKIGDFNYASYNKVSLKIDDSRPNLKHLITASVLFGVSLDFLVYGIEPTEKIDVDATVEALKKELEMKDRIIEAQNDAVQSLKLMVEMMKKGKE